MNTQKLLKKIQEIDSEIGRPTTPLSEEDEKLLWTKIRGIYKLSEFKNVPFIYDIEIKKKYSGFNDQIWEKYICHVTHFHIAIILRAISILIVVTGNRLKENVFQLN